MSIINLYNHLENENKIQCLECGKKLSATNKSNIIRHYKSVHKKDIIKPRDLNDEPPSKKKKVSVKVEMDRNKFLKCCVGLVAVKNIPFRIFNDRVFFKSLILPYEKTFNTNLNSKNIVSSVQMCSEKIQQILKKKFKNQMVCLKIDIASRMDRSILGINVQYIRDFQICISSLGKYIHNSDSLC